MLNEFVAQNRVSVVRNGVQSSIRGTMCVLSFLFSLRFSSRCSYAFYSSDSFSLCALSRVREFVYFYINMYTSKEYMRFWCMRMYVCAGL